MRTRRGLGSVVGMVFAIIAIVTSIGYVTFSMNLLDQYNQSVLARNQVSIDKGNENFQVYSVKIVNGKFNVTVANTGNLPINVTRIWITNSSCNCDWTNYYSINKLVNPGTLLTNIGQNSPVGANTANSYNIKLATSRGNSLQFTLGSPGVKPMLVQLMILPSYVYHGAVANATIIYLVTNNMTSNNLLTNLQPNISCTGNIAGWSLKIGPNPPQYSTLPSGGTAIFRWVYSIGAASASGQKEQCTASLGNPATNNVIEYGYIQ